MAALPPNNKAIDSLNQYFKNNLFDVITEEDKPKKGDARLNQNICISSESEDIIDNKSKLLQKRFTFDTFLNGEDIHKHLKSLDNMKVNDIFCFFAQFVTDIKSLIEMKKFFKKNYNIDCLAKTSMKTIIKNITMLRLVANKKLSCGIKDEHGNVIKDEHGCIIKIKSEPCVQSELYFSENVDIAITIYHDKLFVNHFFIVKEQPVSKTKNEPPKFCYNCLNKNDNMKYCGHCEVFSYCSTECQKMDWKAHKTICTEYVKDTPY